LASDEEAAEHEEEIDAGPAIECERAEDVGQRTLQVEGDDGEDGQGAQGVEAGKSFGLREMNAGGCQERGFLE